MFANYLSDYVIRDETKAKNLDKPPTKEPSDYVEFITHVL